MKVLILCGGLGTRAYPYTQLVPKALMPVCGRPIVEQVMRIYASQGRTDFVLAGGYLHDDLERYFRDDQRWQVEVIDTGDTADTGTRVRRCLDRLGPRFHATYCDGLGDVDIGALETQHRRAGGVTITTVPLRSQFGIVDSSDDGIVTGFREKPVLPDFSINAGFFAVDGSEIESVSGTNLEQHVLPALAERGRVQRVDHGGFWRSMDTFKDREELDDEWAPYSADLDQRLSHLAEPPLPGWLTDRYQRVAERVTSA